MDIVPAGRVITSNFFQTSSYTQKIYCYYDQVEHAGITYELPPCTDTCDECIDPNITEAGFKLRFQNSFLYGQNIFRVSNNLKPYVRQMQIMKSRFQRDTVQILSFDVPTRYKVYIS